MRSLTGESTESSRADTSDSSRGGEVSYYGHESRSISMPGDEDCRGARERNKSRIGIIAVRDGTGMHTCPRLAVVCAVNVDRSRGRCARAVLIIGLSIRAILTSARNCDPGTYTCKIRAEFLHSLAFGRKTI